MKDKSIQCPHKNILKRRKNHTTILTHWLSLSTEQEGRQVVWSVAAPEDGKGQASQPSCSLVMPLGNLQRSQEHTAPASVFVGGSCRRTSVWKAEGLVKSQDRVGQLNAAFLQKETPVCHQHRALESLTENAGPWAPPRATLGCRSY